LAAVHAGPAERWPLGRPAQEAGMSRSTFAFHVAVAPRPPTRSCTGAWAAPPRACAGAGRPRPWRRCRGWRTWPRCRRRSRGGPGCRRGDGCGREAGANAREAEAMEQLEREILAGLGIADPYTLPD